MIRNKKLWFLAALVGIALLTTGCHFWSHDPARMANHIVEELTDELELTQEQQTKLEKIKGEILAQHNSMKDQRGQGFDLLIAEFGKDKLDVAKLQAEMQKRDAQRQTHREFMLSKLAEFHAILTPAQRVKMVELTKKFQEKHAKRGWGHHGPMMF